ncbi:metal-dependent hydrolase [Citreicella sp. C3M06]|uniref:metal-dependent hydrolase n=1 Tax=Citreicella sp. C3M06 TaxID=2841564 RepID=UPI001C09ECF1|nr:metal-dependent hydrolase [Citreicella sp. C3M06]MBU2963267.1 metal-dependent hydrolase [Citreicella sp. C3M06]
MQIIWLGHGSFRFEIADEVILVDPWLSGNPMLPDERRAEALDGATQILLTHGHFDHTDDVVSIARETGLPVSGMFELTSVLEAQGVTVGHAFNKGGTAMFGDVAVSMVPASHSSSMMVDGKVQYTGSEVGYVIRGDGHCIYFSGDTTIMADMAWIGEYYAPTVGILSAGGYYTMDMEMAGWAAKKYFDFKTVIPMHYRTFGALEQDAEVLAAELPGVRVIEPQVLEPITL